VLIVIVRYLGYQDTIGMRQGLLLAEASHGNLQQYIDENNSVINLSLRKKWCRQTAESIAYLHSQGVIHSDLRPENFLVHDTPIASRDIWLCDFGGSTCEELDLDGGHLPDAGFFDPTQGHISTPATDIFSLGSILYTILTGHWPYKSPGPFKTGEEMDKYDQKVDLLFRQRKFPDVGGLMGGRVVMGCWMKEYSTAEEILCALKVEMSVVDDE
jgi:serine/threonine protein kinase